MIIYAIAAVPVIIGIILVTIGLLIRNRPKGRIRGGIYTTALVVDTAERVSYYKKSRYNSKAPIVEFETEKGYVKAVYPYFTQEDYYNIRVGDTLKICYDKNNTNRFHIEEDGSHRDISAFLTGGGIFMILSEIIILIRYGNLF